MGVDLLALRGNMVPEMQGDFVAVRAQIEPARQEHQQLERQGREPDRAAIESCLSGAAQVDFEKNAIGGNQWGGISFVLAGRGLSGSGIAFRFRRRGRGRSLLRRR